MLLLLLVVVVVILVLDLDWKRREAVTQRRGNTSQKK
jgi:hypothetical protein